MHQHSGLLIMRACTLAAVLAAAGCGSKSHSSIRNPASVIALPTGKTAAVKSDADGILTATLTASTTEAQNLVASAGSNISGVAVGFPAGSLSIATDITLKEGVTVDQSQLVGDLGLDGTSHYSSTAVPVEVSSSQPIDLVSPMVIALNLPASAGLASDLPALDRLGVIYRIGIQATGEHKIGFIPATQLALSGDRKLLYPSKYFGWFQVVVFDQAVKATEKASTLLASMDLVVLLDDATLPSCGKADLGRTVYVQSTKQFEYCASTGWSVINLVGPQGATGAAGTNGVTGSTGSAGSAGAAGIPGTLFDSLARGLGTILAVNASNVLVKVGTKAASNVGLIYADVGTGKINAACATGNCGGTTYYMEAGCTGTPYFTSPPGRDMVVPTAATFLRATASETVSSYGPFQASYSTGQSCVVTPYGSFSSYKITNTYSFPSGAVTPPYSSPLYIGP